MFGPGAFQISLKCREPQADRQPRVGLGPAGSEQIFVNFKEELLSASAMLALTAHGNPGEYDGSLLPCPRA